jgi:hypothetical protein
VRVVAAEKSAKTVLQRPPNLRKQLANKEHSTMNVSAWSIKNPIPAVMLFVLLTLAGLMSFNAMKVQQFPDLELPTVTVSASLPGAAPAQLETRWRARSRTPLRRCKT